MMQDDYEGAWEHYMAYTNQGGSRVFTELLANAGMESPFEAETLKKVCEKAKTWLDAYDLSGIE
jgi:oligoendopeptidase F